MPPLRDGGRSRGCDWPRLGFVACVFLAATATAEAQTASTPAACDKVFFGDLAQGLRFDLGSTCARLTGEIDDVYQDDLSTHGSGVPTAAQSRSGSPAARSINTATAIAILDTRQATPLGELSTNLLAQWQKASHDGTDAGSATVQSLYGSLAGATVGYTHSLMNFWFGDFQFLATTPDLSVGIASYEHQIADHLKLAAAVESGLPTQQQIQDGIGSLDFSSPTVTSRLRYATLGGPTFHLSGLLRRADFPATSNVPFLSDRSSTETGWAASFGATVPVPIAGTYNLFSMQATYAVDAPQTLGTKADLAATQSELRFAAPTTGWSIVGSFSHPWNARLTSNVFVSYISLDADLVHAQPSAQVTRVAANLYWRMFDGFRVGAEVGYLHSTLAANGAEGFLSGVSGDAVLGFVSAKWTF
jgi:Porin subfamily